MTANTVAVLQITMIIMNAKLCVEGFLEPSCMAANYFTEWKGW